MASLLAGYGELQFDENSRTAYIEEVENGPDDRHGKEEHSNDEQQPEQEYAADESIEAAHPRVFGDWFTASANSDPQTHTGQI